MRYGPGLLRFPPRSLKPLIAELLRYRYVPAMILASAEKAERPCYESRSRHENCREDSRPSW